jgi:hypothetical protein
VSGTRTCFLEGGRGLRRDMEGMSCICALIIIIMHLALLFLNDSCVSISFCLPLCNEAATDVSV